MSQLKAAVQPETSDRTPAGEGAASKSSGDPHVTVLLSEADALLNEAGPESSIARRALQLVAAGVLSLVPGAGAVVQDLAREILDQRQSHVIAAVRRLIAALGSVSDDVRHRLESDPRFADFVERVFADSMRADQREKLEYYARLLERSAPPSGPDEDERIRLLDTLDALRNHHLRLFHAIANAEAPLQSGPVTSIWETVEAMSGVAQEAAERDLAELQRLLLVDAGWTSTTNLRLNLTEFGLRFERYVAADGERPRPRWLVELVRNGDYETLGALAHAFAVANGPTRIVRERGGMFLASTDFEQLNDPDEVRRIGGEIVARIRAAGSLQARNTAMQPGAVSEWHEGGETTYPAPKAESSDEPRSDTPLPAIEPIAERLVATDPAVARAIAHLEEGSWESLVRCMEAIEADIGSLRGGFRDVSADDVIRFDSAAIAEDLDRPPTNQVAAMSRDQATAVVRNAMRSWLYVKAGYWPRP